MLSTTGALRARFTESMRRPLALLALMAAALLALATAPAALAQSSFTWTGAASDQNWSDSSNWAGAAAPSGTVSTLSFPQLTSPACAASPPSATCYQSNNDLSGVSANALSINDNAPFMITGNAITLGSGGLTATPSGTAQFANPTLSLPITLSAPQTWTIAGGSDDQQLSVSNVTGDQALTIDLSNQTFLGLEGDAEVGAVTASGSGTLALDGSLNGADGNAVSLTGGAGLFASSATAKSGALSVSGGNVQVGDGSSPDGTLAVDGAVTLDLASSLSMYIDQPGTTPSTDFSQLSATGNIDLGSATLLLDQGRTSSGGCVDLTPGQVDTLITTTGSLSGELTDPSTGSPIANGDTVTIQNQCDPGSGVTSATATINYTSSAVTATIKTAGHAGDVPQNTSPPTISGTAQQGDTLSASTGTWTNSPTSFTYQWFDCNASFSCNPISGATSSTYTLTSSDVGDTVFVQVTATNSFGSNSAGSNPTAVVQGASNSAPVNTALPVISGSAQQGDTLSASTGTWTNSPTSYAYQWQDCDSAGGSCTSISGATNASYTLSSGDVGHTIRVQVSASNAAGTGGPVSSAQTGVVTAPAPVVTKPASTAPPTVSGVSQVGDTLYASTGSWSGTAPLSYAYQWQRCDPGCQSIPGASAATYKLVAGDRGAKVRVVVTASNSAGSAYAISGELGPVTAPGVSVQAIRRALGMIHPPLGGAASIPQLLRHHGYRLLFAAPAAGLLQVGWYTPVKIRVKVRGRHGKRARFRTRTVLRLIARLSLRISRRGKVRRMLGLTPAGVRLLRHARNRVVIERLAFTPAHQGATRLGRRFRLRR